MNKKLLETARGFESKAAEAALIPTGVTHAEVEVEDVPMPVEVEPTFEFVHVLVMYYIISLSFIKLYMSCVVI